MFQAKKRLALAITLAEPGGAQVFLLGFAQWLKEQGYDVHVIAGDGAWLFEQCSLADIPAHRLRHMGRAIHPFRDPLAFIELWILLRRLRPDAIHLNSTKMGVTGSLAARAAGIKRVVYRIGGWVFLEPLSSFMRRCYLNVERWSAHLKDMIVCVHPGDAEAANRFDIRPRENVRVVPNGIELPAFDQNLKTRTEARTRLGLSEEAFAFGTVANFYPVKDLPRYLEACALVHQKYSEARFILIGEGPERNAIEQKRRELDLDQAVLLPGTFQNKARELLRGLDAFVLPSAKEGMSWALLEAMAAALPCIATDVGANRWMLEPKAGWIVPKQSPTALAEVMLEVLQHQEERQTSGARARRAVEERFPLSKTYQDNAAAL